MTEKIQEIERLMKEARDANRGAIKHLFDVMYDPLFHLVSKKLSDPQQAKDIVQEAFSALLEKGLLHFNNYDEVKNCLLNYTTDACASHLRSSAEHDKQLSELLYLTGEGTITAEEERIEAETIQLISRAFNKLPPKRKAILTQILKGASTEEVAEKLNLKEKGIHTINYVTLTILRKALK